MTRTRASSTPSSFPPHAAAESLERRTLLSVSLVQDIHAGNVGSNPSNILGTPTGVLFSANDEPNGSPTPVWKTDGTAAGTTKLDNPPPQGLGLLSNAVSFNGSMYFIKSEGQGEGLWKTDGTASGTVPVFDNFTGGSTQIVVANGKMFFRDDQFGNFGLWVSDGTSGGTRFLNGLPVPAPDQPLVVLGNKVFFAASTSSGTGEVWYSDGTNAGSGKLIGGLGNGHVLVAGSDRTLYIFAGSGTGHGLYKSDGTPAGTALVSDVSGASTGNPDELAVIGDTALFTASDSQYGTQLWSSDGTAPGTQRVRVIDAYDPTIHIDALQFNTFHVVNGQVVFFLTDFLRPDQTGLWRSDGTATNTYLLQPMVRQPGTNWSDLTSFGDSLYFRGDDGTHGPQLWKTNGLKASFLPINPFSFADPKNITVANGTLYFSANDGQHGQELWTSDGTAAGTHLVKDLNLNPNSSNPSNLLDVNGTLYFAATDSHGVQVWSSDGTQAGTKRLTNLSPDETGDTYDSSFGIEQLTAGNGVFFVTPANDVWHVDAGGTVSKIFQAPAGSPQMAIASLAAAGNQAYFIVTSPLGTYSFYRTNGTAAGTVKLAQWAHGPLGIERIVPLGSQVIFEALSGDTPQVWHSDGTFSGTGALTNFQPQAGVQIDTADLLSASSVTGNTLYFVTNETSHVGTSADEVTTRQLWKTDGTTAGTTLVDPRFGFQFGSTPQLLGSNGSLDFFASRGNSVGLWQVATDGSESLVVPTSSLPLESARLNGKIYFILGHALWVTDGTQAGTQQVKQVGTNSFGRLFGLVTTNDMLYFVGEDADHGTELWQSDGTAAGTQVAADIVPGFGSSNPQKLTAVGDNVFFTSDDGTHGRELWLARPPVLLNFSYLLGLAQHYGQEGTFATGDLNGDGKVDFADLLLLTRQYGNRFVPRL